MGLGNMGVSSHFSPAFLPFRPPSLFAIFLPFVEIVHAISTVIYDECPSPPPRFPPFPTLIRLLRLARHKHKHKHKHELPISPLYKTEYPASGWEKWGKSKVPTGLPNSGTSEACT